MQASAPAYLPVSVGPARDTEVIQALLGCCCRCHGAIGISRGDLQSPCLRARALPPAGSAVASAKLGTGSIHLDGRCRVQGVGLSRQHGN